MLNTVKTPFNRIVLLVDMDCFYCQVEEKLDPSLKGKPMAVVQYNAWRDGGIIAVNYAARAKGVTRHMRGDEAKKQCPDIQLVRVPNIREKADLSKYREAGKNVARVLQRFTPLLERASVDEAYMDITNLVNKRHEAMNDGSFILQPQELINTHAVGFSSIGKYLTTIMEKHMNPTLDYEQFYSKYPESDVPTLRLSNIRLLIGASIASEIRSAVLAESGYECSAGIAHNKILAKLACGMNKPNKQTILPLAQIDKLFATLPVSKIKGLGAKFGEEVCQRLGIRYLGQLRMFTESELQRKFDDKNGTWLYYICRGIDLEVVTPRFYSKSIGCCKKFPGPNNITGIKTLQHWLKELANEINERLEEDIVENNRRARQMVVNFVQEINSEEVSSSRSAPINCYDTDFLSRTCLELIKTNTKQFFRTGSESVINNPIKLLGISVGKFETISNSQNKIQDMFAQQAAKKKRLSEDKVVASANNDSPYKAEKIDTLNKNEVMLENEQKKNDIHSIFSNHSNRQLLNNVDDICSEDIFKKPVKVANSSETSKNIINEGENKHITQDDINIESAKYGATSPNSKNIDIQDQSPSTSSHIHHGYVKTIDDYIGTSSAILKDVSNKVHIKTSIFEKITHKSNEKSLSEIKDTKGHIDEIAEINNVLKYNPQSNKINASPTNDNNEIDVQQVAKKKRISDDKQVINANNNINNEFTKCGVTSQNSKNIDLQDQDPSTSSPRLNARSIGCCEKFNGRNSITGIKSLQHWLKELANEINERLEKDIIENNRRATQMVVNFVQEINSEEVLSSRSAPLNCYDTDFLSRTCLELIKTNTKQFFRTGSESVINNPIKLLSISVGKFEAISKSQSNIHDEFAQQAAKMNRLSDDDKVASDSNDIPYKAGKLDSLNKNYVMLENEQMKNYIHSNFSNHSNRQLLNNTDDICSEDIFQKTVKGSTSFEKLKKIITEQENKHIAQNNINIEFAECGTTSQNSNTMDIQGQSPSTSGHIHHSCVKAIDGYIGSSSASAIEDMKAHIEKISQINNGLMTITPSNKINDSTNDDTNAIDVQWAAISQTSINIDIEDQPPSTSSHIHHSYKKTVDQFNGTSPGAMKTVSNKDHTKASSAINAKFTLKINSESLSESKDTKGAFLEDISQINNVSKCNPQSDNINYDQINGNSELNALINDLQNLHKEEVSVNSSTVESQPTSSDLYKKRKFSEISEEVTIKPDYRSEYVEYALPAFNENFLQYTSCITCGAKILNNPTSLQTHEDHHFAQELSQQQRLEFREIIRTKINSKKLTETANNKKKNLPTNINLNSVTSSITKFLKVPLVSTNPEIATPNENTLEVCNICNSAIKREEIMQHKDFHMAKDLQKQLNKLDVHTVDIKKPKTETSRGNLNSSLIIPSRKTKAASKPITTFFTQSPL